MGSVWDWGNEWEKAETCERAWTQGVAWFRVKAHQMEVIKQSNGRVFIRSNQTSELLEVTLSGVEGHRSDPSSGFPATSFQRREPALQTANINISFQIMLANVCICRYMHMPVITKTPSRVRVKRMPQNRIFKHPDRTHRSQHTWTLESLKTLPRFGFCL